MKYTVKTFEDGMPCGITPVSFDTKAAAAGHLEEMLEEDRIGAYKGYTYKVFVTEEREITWSHGVVIGD